MHSNYEVILTENLASGESSLSKMSWKIDGYIFPIESFLGVYRECLDRLNVLSSASILCDNPQCLEKTGLHRHRCL